MVHTVRLNNTKFTTDFFLEPKIGDILQKDDKGFIYIGSISRIIPDFEKYITTVTTTKNIQHTDDVGIQVTFNAKAKLPGIAEGDLVIDFKNKNTHFVALREVTINKLDHLAISEEVEAYWKKKNLHTPLIRGRTFLVGTSVTAQSGVYIHSKSINNQIVLGGQGNIAVSGLPIALEGKLDVRAERNQFQKIISSTPINCIFQALKKQVNGYELLG